MNGGKDITVLLLHVPFSLSQIFPSPGPWVVLLKVTGLMRTGRANLRVVHFSFTDSLLFQEHRPKVSSSQRSEVSHLEADVGAREVRLPRLGSQLACDL